MAQRRLNQAGTTRHDRPPNLLWYLAARLVGLDRFRVWIERYGRWLTLDWPDVERAHRLFGRFGAVIVMIGRLIPTIRSVVSIPAGLVRMRLPRFLIWSSLGTALWSSALAVAGWLLGRQFGRVEEVIGPISTGVVVLIVGIYIWRQFTWSKRNR